MPQLPIPIAIGQQIGGNSYVAGQYGKQRELWTGSRHGGDYASAYNKLSFFGANQAAATLSTGLATTYTGLCLSNPAASTVNLVVQHVSVSLVVITTAVSSIWLIGGFSAAGVVTHTTPLTVYNNVIGTAVTAAQGLVDAACTIVGTPIYIRALGETGIAAGVFTAEKDMMGGLIIPPGGYVAFGMPVATPVASAFWASIGWEEVAP
jgi:hypothetical protein